MSRPMLVSRFSIPNRSTAAQFGALLLLCVATSACSGSIGSDQAGPTTTSESSPTSEDRPDDLAATAPNGVLNCRSVSEDPIGTVQRSDLIEASGVVASRNHDGVLWSHNDSGAAAGVFAFDDDGNDLGFFELAVDAVDIEDIAIDDDTIYLADIGDNARTRDTITIYVFDEPTPTSSGSHSGGSQSGESVAVREAITTRYPHGPTDAEALLVDPITGDLVILGKDLDDSTAPTTIYVLTAGGDGSYGSELTAAGTIDVAELTRRSSAFSLSGLAFPGAATGMDITDDGSLIALRTYGSVWLFSRSTGVSVAEALATQPCEGGAEAEAQGESVGFLPSNHDGLIRYVTVSEGRNPAVNLSVVEVQIGN